MQQPEVEILEKLHIFKGSMLNEVTTMRKKGVSEEQISAQIKMAIIAYYDKMATEQASEDDILLINKN